MEPQKRDFKGSGQFDRYNSTYMHQIHLNTGLTLQGYSKNKFYPEMQDKIVCLQRVIERLVRSGYLEGKRTMKIIFYKNAFLDQTSEQLLTLYPDRFEFSNNMDFVLNEQLNSFLQRLYQMLKQRIVVTAEISDKPKTQPVDNIFSTEYKRFKTRDELHNFIIKKQKEGYERGQIEAFYRAYTEKYF